MSPSTRLRHIALFAALLLAAHLLPTALAQGSTGGPPAATSTPADEGYLARSEVQDFISDLQQRLGLPRAELEEALGTARHLPQVIDLIKPAASPLVRSWQRYRARFLDATRIQGGQRFMQQHAAALARAEARYGVPPEIIAAIIGVETVYGRNTGNFVVLDALATLAFDYPPRAALFRKELESLFLLARETGTPVRDYKGSYAGAIGVPQFLPSSIRAFAVDFDNDGRIDLRGSPVDAIGSVARYLAEHGWQRGARIVVRARLSDNANLAPLLAAGFLPSFDTQQLSQQGVTPAAPLGAGEKTALIDLITPDQGTEYWLGLHNFYAITRYNRSSFYAMAVHDLAQVLRTRNAP